MDRQQTGNGRHPETSRSEPQEQMFVGFLPLTGNFLYCPNQFFDLCLAHHSRGVVRLVGYLLRRTLGWLDEHGKRQPLSGVRCRAAGVGNQHAVGGRRPSDSPTAAGEVRGIVLSGWPTAP
jgi:hypothetical protein